MRITTKIKGEKELRRKLDKIDQLHRTKELPKAIANGALVAVLEAKRRVPVDSGDLRDSLHIGGFTKLTPAFRVIGIYGALPGPKGSGRHVGVLAGTKLPYAHLVEMGTRRSRAQPFLRPAVDGNVDKITKGVDQGLQQIIDEA